MSDPAPPDGANGANGCSRAAGPTPGGRTVHLEGAAVETIRRHARESAPAECCGALVGLATDGSTPSGAAAGDVRVARVLAADNVAPDDRHYLLAPADVARAEAEAAEVGLEVVGFYHSHPGSAPVPSATDLACAWPWYSYLIVDARSGELRAWRLAEDRSGFLEEELRVEPAS